MIKYLIAAAPFLIVLIHKILIHFGVKTVCIWYLLTGHRCLGCGITTATVYLLEGKIKPALEANPLVIIVVPILIYCWLKYIYKNFIKGKRRS